MAIGIEKALEGPVRSILDMRDRIDSLLAEVFQRRAQERALESEEDAWAPAVSIKETTDSMVLYAALPGLDRQNVNVEIKDGALQLSGRLPTPLKENEEWLRSEIVYGRFFRSFRLGQQVDPSSVKANMKDGMLEITMPKTEGARTSKIQVE